jgi:hypothetical protein
MANLYMTASAAVGTASGYQNRASKIMITGDQAVATIGSVILKQDGTGGTAVWKCYMDGGSSGQFTIPNIQFDYVTIDNVEVCIEFYKAHGFK